MGYRSYLLNGLSIYFAYELVKKGENIIRYIHIIQYTEVISIYTIKRIIKHTKVYKLFEEFTTLINTISSVRRNMLIIIILKIFL